VVQPDLALRHGLDEVACLLGLRQEWFEVLPAAMGVEGLVLKSTAAR
jgi:hypothetical protein